MRVLVLSGPMESGFLKVEHRHTHFVYVCFCSESRFRNTNLLPLTGANSVPFGWGVCESFIVIGKTINNNCE